MAIDILVMRHHFGDQFLPVFSGKRRPQDVFVIDICLCCLYSINDCVPESAHVGDVNVRRVGPPQGGLSSGWHHGHPADRARIGGQPRAKGLVSAPTNPCPPRPKPNGMELTLSTW
jgi:hypothetical protein